MPMETMDLTPNYTAIFKHMLEEAKQASNAHDMFCELDIEPEARALRSVQRWFAPLTIAAQSATTREDIESLRNVMLKIVADISGYARQLEVDVEADRAMGNR